MLRFRPVRRFLSGCCRRRPSSDGYPSPLPSPSHAVSASRRLFFGVLKFGSCSALLATGYATYVTYAYTLEELFVKTFDFRQFEDLPPMRNRVSVPLPESDEKTENFMECVKPDKDAITPSLLGYDNFSISFVSRVAVGAVCCMYLTIRVLYEDLARETSMQPLPDKLLSDMDPNKQQLPVYTLVLDLNDTLVHSDWEKTTKCEFVEGGQSYKRPGLDAFLDRVCEMGHYELVLYSDALFTTVLRFSYRPRKRGHFAYSLSKRSNCYRDGRAYRDLSKLNRDPSRILYVSGHALENCLQPENCVPIKPWKKEVDDTTLADLLNFLEYIAHYKPNDVRPLLSSFKGKDIATEFSKYGKNPDDVTPLFSSFKGKVIDRIATEFAKYQQRGGFGSGGWWWRS